MFRRFAYTMARFMSGRYGTDALNRFLLVVYLLLWLVTTVFVRHLLTWRILTLVCTFLAVVTLWRTLSRNIPRRQAENRWFLRWWSPIQYWFSRQGRRLRDIRRCRYRKCPGCGMELRLPIKRGRRTVTCYRCRAQFKRFFL